MAGKKIDFFISYTGSDLAWAEWVDYCLKQAGYSTIVQFNDFSAGRNIINEGSHEVKTVRADASAAVLTTLDTSCRA